MSSDCPACGSVDQRPFHTESSVPAHSCLLLSSHSEAIEFPRGSLELVFCEACGFITNSRFDPGMHDYSPQYEETQIFSPRFQRFARDLASDWVDRFHLARAAT